MIREKLLAKLAVYPKQGEDAFTISRLVDQAVMSGVAVPVEAREIHTKYKESLKAASLERLRKQVEEAKTKIQNLENGSCDPSDVMF